MTIDEQNRMIHVMTRMFINDLHEHYANADNSDCNHCRRMSDEEAADLAARRTVELVRYIRIIQS